MLFFGLAEGETLASMQPGGEASFRPTSENYARGIAAGVRCWSGETPAPGVRVFSSSRELSASCVHFNGLARALFANEVRSGAGATDAALAREVQGADARRPADLRRRTAHVR